MKTWQPWRTDTHCVMCQIFALSLIICSQSDSIAHALLRCDIAVSNIDICPIDVCCLMLCFIVLLFSVIAAVYMVNEVKYIGRLQCAVNEAPNITQTGIFQSKSEHCGSTSI